MAHLGCGHDRSVWQRATVSGLSNLHLITLLSASVDVSEFLVQSVPAVESNLGKDQLTRAWPSSLPTAHRHPSPPLFSVLRPLTSTVLAYAKHPAISGLGTKRTGNKNRTALCIPQHHRRLAPPQTTRACARALAIRGPDWHASATNYSLVHAPSADPAVAAATCHERACICAIRDPRAESWNASDAHRRTSTVTSTQRQRQNETQPSPWRRAEADER